jgi:hypothetical protein
MVTASADPTQLSKRLTWNKLVFITLMVMLIGVIGGSFMIGRFGFFTPPLLPYTILIYLLLWMPAFVIGLLLRPTGRRLSLLLLVVLGMVILAGGLVLLGPTFSYTSGSCQPAPLPEQPVRYECVSAPNYQNERFNYVLRGSTGSPFVRLDESSLP